MNTGGSNPQTFFKKVELTNGENNFNVKEIGKHTAEVRYSGNDNYSPCSVSSTFEIVSCYIYCEDVIYGSNLLTIFIEADEPAGDVVAIVNGKRYTAPVVRGSAFIELEKANEIFRKDNDTKNSKIIEDILRKIKK